MSVFDYIQQGGPVMYLLLLLNIIGFALLFWKGYTIFGAKKNFQQTKGAINENLASFVKNTTAQESTVAVIKDEIQLHKHEEHSEKLLVIEGAANIVVGEKKFKVKVGDHFVVSKNEFHSIKTISKSPVKFIAIRSSYDHIE